MPNTKARPSARAARPKAKRRATLSKQRSYRHSLFETLEPRQVLATTLVGLPDHVTVLAGQPIHIALNGEDDNSSDFFFHASSSNPAFTAYVPQGNESLKISVSQRGDNGALIRNFGDMVLQLFRDKAPDTVDRITDLARTPVQGQNRFFYDGLTFHRIIDGFMIQGGDPLGTGSGGTGQKFPDEFHPDLLHSSSGVLSMANSGPNTNDSQFFITDAATPWLNGRHTVFGFLTEGKGVLQAISGVATDANNRPENRVVMDKVEVIDDRENGVLMLAAPAGTSGQGVVTITVIDSNGEVTEHKINVTVVPPPTWPQGAPITVQAGVTNSAALPSLNFAGTQYTVSPVLSGTGLVSNDLRTTVNASTGAMTITPNAKAVGVRTLFASATALDQYVYNTQQITLIVEPGKPTLELTPSSDSGVKGDGITNLNNAAGRKLRFWVNGVVGEDAQLSLSLDGRPVEHNVLQKVARNDGSGSYQFEVEIKGDQAIADGAHAVNVTQTVTRSGRTLTSPASGPLGVFVDTAAPVFSTQGGTTARLGAEYVYDAATNEDPNVVFSLKSLIAGMQLDGASGVIRWTPGPGQSGQAIVTIEASDRADNKTQQQFTVTVVGAPVFQPIDAQPVEEGGTLRFDVSAIDSQATGGQVNITIVGTTLPQGAAPSFTRVDNDTFRFAWTTTETDGPGTYQLTLEASDSTGAKSTKVVSLSVLEKNQAPVLRRVYDDWSVGDVWSIDEGEAFGLDFEASDADLPRNRLVFSLLGESPQGMRIDPATGAITWTPGEMDGGREFRATVAVSDGAGGSDQATIAIRVREVNRPPVFQTLAPQFAQPGTTYGVTVVAQDPDRGTDPAQPIRSVRYSFVGDVPEGASIDPVSGRISWPVPNGFADNRSASDPVTFQVRAVEVVGEGEVALEATLAVPVFIVDPIAAVMFANLARVPMQVLVPDGQTTSPLAQLNDPVPADRAIEAVTSTDYDNRGLFGTEFGPDGGGGSVDLAMGTEESQAQPPADGEQQQQSDEGNGEQAPERRRAVPAEENQRRTESEPARAADAVIERIAAEDDFWHEGEDEDENERGDGSTDEGELAARREVRAEEEELAAAVAQR